MSRPRRFSRRAIVVAITFSAVAAASAQAAATPGWECVPTTQGQAVVSGGTGAAPVCAGSTTPVLAPTYVASGVGGKHTVQFSAVNLQVVDGAGATASVNGTGNLVIGYAENAGSAARTGSHDLVVGSNNGWSSYGGIAAGTNNVVSGAFASAFGASNSASGSYSTVAGRANAASGAYASVLSGAFNLASAPSASVNGGEHNKATSQYSAIAGGCDGLTGPGAALNTACAATGYEAILGGVSNRADGPGNSAAGGDFNTVGGSQSSIAGGEANTTADFFNTIAGGQSNLANVGQGMAIAGGLNENVQTDQATKVGASTFTP